MAGDRARGHVVGPGRRDAEGRAPALVPHGGRLGLPADFLIAADGTIVAHKRGEHAYDQWSVDEILAASASATAR